jgi:hypothetical protein
MWLWQARDAWYTERGFIVKRAVVCYYRIFAERRQANARENAKNRRSPMGPVVSVIVPCYRVEAYLVECLDSVCGLPPTLAEVLCVDDASPDRTGAILAEYASRFSHVRVLTHETNRGLSAARNTGLDQARGEYVLFLDGDDALCADAVEPLLRQAQADRLDILQAAYECFEDGTNRALPARPMARATGVATGDACLARQCAEGAFEPMTVIRLYRRAFLAAHGLRMAEGFLFEDELFTAPAFLVAERARVSDALLYRDRRRAGGIMSGFATSAEWCAHYLAIAERLVARCEAPRPTPGQRALRRRAAAIALSIPKNIAAYGLTGAARQEALAFARAHRAAILRLTGRGAGVRVRAQAALLRLSLPLFLRLYGLASG